MKPVEEWDEGDLLNLIQAAAQEGTRLDFKGPDACASSDPKKLAISKMVSALANADGGMLIFGMIEDGHVATDIVGIDPAAFTKETLDQIITSKIRPALKTTIRPIPLSGKNAGKVAYVVDVPQATTYAPHQAADDRYYKRRNFHIHPMEDYEIRDAMRRADAPELHFEYSAKLIQVEGDAHDYEFTVSLGNRSPQPALYSSVSLFFDSELKARAPKLFGKPSAFALEVDGTEHPCDRFRLNLAVPNQPPLYAETVVEVGAFTLTLRPNWTYMFAHRIATPGFKLFRKGNLSLGNGALHQGWVPV